MNLARLTTVAGLAALKGADEQPLFPEATVRDWMRADLRGFRTRCVVLAGGKTLVDLDALEEWLEAGRGAGRTRKRAAVVTPPSLRAAPSFDEARERGRLRVGRG